jgi:hypothetical protein
VSLRALCLTVTVLVVTYGASAQSTRGTLRGTAADTAGGRIPSAKIAVETADSAFRREASSNDRGEFCIDDLPVAVYHIIVSANGFAAASSEVEVVLGSVRQMMVILEPSVLRQSVTIRGEASSITTEPIDTTSAVHQAIVTAQDLETIPLAARSFANIAYLAPGTEPVEPSDPTKARITAIATGGSSGLNNELSVDGGDNSDDWIGGFLQNFSPEPAARPRVPSSSAPSTAPINGTVTMPSTSAPRPSTPAFPSTILHPIPGSRSRAKIM